MSLDAVFDFKLQFRVVGTKLERNFIHELWSHSKMTPTLQILVLLMLKLVLPFLEELAELMSHCVGMTLVTYIVTDHSLKFISLQSQWLRHWRRWDLSDHLISELILYSWLFKEHIIRPDVKHTEISFICVRIRIKLKVNYLPVCKGFSRHLSAKLR